MKLLLALSLIFNLQNNDMNDNQNEIVLGGGCFWCVEAVFEGVKGVENITSGYSGGIIKNPSYREVSKSSACFSEKYRWLINVKHSNEALGTVVIPCSSAKR